MKVEEICSVIDGKLICGGDKDGREVRSLKEIISENTREIAIYKCDMTNIRNLVTYQG